MVELDGRQYIIKTPAENTADMLNRINTYCADNNIVNSKNETIAIEAKFSSPIYLILWALGYLVTVIQNLIYAVAKGYNVQASSEQQLLNLADMANIKRGKASVTTFRIRVQAMSEDDGDDYDATAVTCTITSEDIITYDGVVYKPALYPSIVLQPRDIAYITMVAQNSAQQQISEGTIAGFDTPIINLKTFTQYDSIPGQDEESIASLRNRLQRKQLSGTTFDAAMDAIRSLPGVTTCNIFYNTSSLKDAIKYVGEDMIPVAPRNALVIVQGYNQNIGHTFYEHLACPADYEMLSSIPTNRILEVQYYTSHANQQIPCVLITPKQKQIKIRAHIGRSCESSVEQAMIKSISELGYSLTIGESITSSMILNKLAAYNAYDIMGAEVSSDDGQTWNFRSTQADDVLWVFNTANIEIIMPEVEK